MFKAKYKDKWHNIKDIAKSDDGVVYQLEGIEGDIYSKDINDLDMSKDDSYEITNPDGSIKRGPGKEPLMKPFGKSVTERWELLKAEINHEKAFMQMIEDEPEDEESPGEDMEDAPSSDQVEDSAQPDQEPSDADAEQPEEEYDEQELIDLLRQEGYSDSEIAHIVHGHVPSDEQQQSDAALDEHSVKLNHAKRMTDLEHDHAKKEKELRLKYLEEELKAKLDNIKNKNGNK